jgi:hypothetical protein
MYICICNRDERDPNYEIQGHTSDASVNGLSMGSHTYNEAHAIIRILLYFFIVWSYLCKLLCFSFNNWEKLLTDTQHNAEPEMLESVITCVFVWFFKENLQKTRRIQ